MNEKAYGSLAIDKKCCYKEAISMALGNPSLMRSFGVMKKYEAPGGLGKKNHQPEFLIY